MKDWLRLGALFACPFAIYGLTLLPADKHRPGSPRVYAEIAASTDCWELRSMFDTAADGPRRPWKIPYMKAAIARMDEVGCA